MMPISADAAETLALQALAWLVAEDELLPVFIGSSGVSAADIRAGASDPAFLASVLDFILMDDHWVTRFCDAAALDYDQPMRARAGLPGGQMMHWT